MIYAHTFDGLPVTTGDILCTSDGTDESWFGRVWHWIGYLVPGHVDHVILYIGPEGRCIDANGRGVIEFTMPGNTWDASQVVDQRWLADTLVGVAYPLQALSVAPKEDLRIRSAVADYCLTQLGKPYNANFLNPLTNDAYYCSQLIYLAYRAAGVTLRTAPPQLITNEGEQGADPLIVLPTHLFNNCPHRLVHRDQQPASYHERS